MSKEQHILVIRMSAMGDVAMFAPVLRALQSQHQNVKITLLTDPFLAKIFKDFDDINIHTIDKKGKHKGFLGLWRLSKELKQYHFSAVADIHNVLRSNILKWLLFPLRCVQIDKGRQAKKALVSGKKVHQLQTTHERYAAVFRKLGLTLDLSQAEVVNKGKIPAQLHKLLSGKSKTKIIGIAPFAAHKSKEYPLDQMKRVIKRLAKDHFIFLFGGKSEQDALTQLSSGKNCTVIAGRFSFEEELDIISNLDVMLAMDSGNGHLAAMYGVKVITIWGVTHPFAGFAPFGQPETHQLLSDSTKYPKIPTSVYGNKYPENYLNAASSITESEVIKKVMEVI